MKTGLSGEYKDQKLRSHAEFIFAVYLDQVKKVKFNTEPFSLYSIVKENKRKVPDFIHIDPDTKQAILTEIKSSADEMQDLILDYATNCYYIPDELTVKFLTLDNMTKKVYTKDIIAVMGKPAWTKLNEDYKEEARANKKFYGFPGALNPRFGAIVSDQTKKNISNALKGLMAGDKNPIYGRHDHLSPEAKLRVAAKWSDPAKKAAMKKKGMITHVNRFSDEQFAEFMNYYNDVIQGKNHKLPKFLNAAYKVNIDKINELFGSSEQFLSCIRV